MVENVYLFLTGLTFLFAIIVATYFLGTVNKKDVVLKKKFMYGHWQREGTSPSTNELWKFDYIINESSLEMRGKNPYFKAKGNYKILKEDENLITLLVDEMQGEGEGDLSARSMSVAVDKQKQKIYIDGRLFKRA